MLNDDDIKAMAIKYYQRYLDLNDRTLIETYAIQPQVEVETISSWLPGSYKEFLQTFGIASLSGMTLWGKSNHPSIDLDTCNFEINQNVLLKSDENVTYFVEQGESVTGFRHPTDDSEPKLVVTDAYGTYDTNDTLWSFLLDAEVDLYQNSKDLPEYGFEGFLDMEF